METNLIQVHIVVQGTSQTPKKLQVFKKNGFQVEGGHVYVLC